jgi:hypothetical protein
VVKSKEKCKENKKHCILDSFVQVFKREIGEIDSSKGLTQVTFAQLTHYGC